MARQLSKPEGSKYEVLTQLNQTNSPLLRLPAELRNHIYGFVFSNALVLVVHKSKQDNFRNSGKYIGPVAFRFTCRQINVETKALFFRNCVFDIGLSTNRDKTEAVLGSACCSTVESALVDYLAMACIRYGIWGRGGKDFLPALKWVHVHPRFMDQKSDTWEMLVKVFGKYNFEMVPDHRAEMFDDYNSWPERYL